MLRHSKQWLAIVAVLTGVIALTLTRSGVLAQLVAMSVVLGRLRPDTVALALALSALSALLSGLLWWRLTLRLGHRMPFRAALEAYLSAGLAGYVVAVAGPALGSAVSLRRHGIGPGRAVLVTLIANALGLAGILVWAPLGMVLLSDAGTGAALPLLTRYGPVALAGVLMVLAVAVLAALRVLASAAGTDNRVARLLLRRGHAAERTYPAPRYRHLLGLVPCSALSWLTGALALYVVLAALSRGVHVSMLSVIGAAVIAATLGSLAFFAPEGVGVKDGVLVALLAHATGVPVTTGVAAALAVRTLDPLTKVGLLAALAVTAEGAPTRDLARAITQHTRRWATLAPARGRVRVGWARASALGATVTLVTALFGSAALARADADRTTVHNQRAAAPVASDQRPPAPAAASAATPHNGPTRAR